MKKSFTFESIKIHLSKTSYVTLEYERQINTLLTGGFCRN